MSFVRFDLEGDMALWRNYQESMGAYSCLGPAPANLAGLAGAALGFASPCSLGATNPDYRENARLSKKGLPWPVSPELLAWQRENDLHAACRWNGGIPSRAAWNVKGIKEIKPGGTLLMQQQVIMHPRYEVVFRLPVDECPRLALALRTPAFPLYLGASCCRAIIRSIHITETAPDGEGWAFHTTGGAWGEATPFSRHRVDATASFERIRRDGYWIYPTPEHPGIAAGSPLVRCWCSADECGL